MTLIGSSLAGKNLIVTLLIGAGFMALVALLPGVIATAAREAAFL